MPEKHCILLKIKQSQHFMKCCNWNTKEVSIKLAGTVPKP